LINPGIEVFRVINLERRPKGHEISEIGDKTFQYGEDG